MTDLSRFKICNPNAMRELFRGPHALTINGEPWAAMTNGHCAVLIRGDTDNMPPFPNGASGAAVIMLPDGLQPVATCTIADVREWASAPVMDKCRRCGGDGTIDCPCPVCDQGTHQCPTCDGDGLAGIKWQPVGIAGVQFNRTLVARAVEHIDDQQINVAVIGSGLTATLKLWSPEVVVTVGGIKPDSNIAPFAGVPWKHEVVTA